MLQKRQNSALDWAFKDPSKRYQMKRYLIGYKSYSSFIQKCFVLRELQAVKYSFITYIWSKVDVFFCYSVYTHCTWNSCSKGNFAPKNKMHILNLQLSSLYTYKENSPFLPVGIRLSLSEWTKTIFGIPYRLTNRKNVLYVIW